MEIQQSIVLDFARDTVPITIFAKQYDQKTRFVNITPLNNGASYTIDEGVTARLQMTKPDGTTVINDAIIENNVIKAELTAQALAAEGIAAAEIGLYKNDELLSSQLFYVKVAKSAYDEDAMESSDEYGSLITATNAANAAATAATNAAESANTAATAATTATTAAETATSAANTAATAAETATTAATTAANSANSAATAANNAASSAATAAGQASQAANAAGIAKIGAETAANSANSAATAATNAANAADTAATAATNAAASANTAATGAANVDISAVQTATGATITVTDRTGTETEVHIDTLAAINTWADVRNAVRLGLGATLFPAGYEFEVASPSGDFTTPFVVRGHDTILPQNNKLSHSMILEHKHMYGSNGAAYSGVQFDAPEALYYAENGLAAGTYNFYWDINDGCTVGYWQFTIHADIPQGGQIVIDAPGKKISTYPSVGSTSPIETNILVSAGADGTYLGSTAAELNHVHRIRYGSNNYAQSAARQLINSSAAAGSVWAPVSKYDRPPSWASSYEGFARNLDSDFLDVLVNAVIPCRTNNVIETASLDGTQFTTSSTYTLNDKFFLLSRPEMFGDWDSASIKDGEILEYYVGLTNAERIRYDKNGSARNCFLRSPLPGLAYSVRYLSSGGDLGSNYADGSTGVAPACIIA